MAVVRRLPVVLLIVALGLAGCAVDGRAAAQVDQDLAAAFEESFPDDHDRAAIAIVEAAEGSGGTDESTGAVRVAFLGEGTGPDTMFEIGSITKTMVGFLLAEAIEQDEVELDDPIGEYLELGDSPAASVTFAELATHTSGLPTFPTDPAWQARAEPGYANGTDIIDETLEQLLAEAAAEPLAPDAPAQYSNLGTALAGQALAAAAPHTADFRDLLAERVLDPLWMDSAVLQVEDDDSPAALAQGHLPDGRPAEPSTLGAYAPAGGVAATIDDLIAYARGILDGPFADSPALDPLDVGDPDVPAGSIGYFWGISEVDGRELLHHGGVTAGFASTIVIDRSAGRAGIVLTNTGESIDGLRPILLEQMAR